MTERAYFRSLLPLPILFPLALAGSGKTNPPFPVDFLLLSVLFGGAAYLVLATLLWIAFGQLPAHRYTRLALVTPWGFVVLEVLVYPIFLRLIESPGGATPFDWASAFSEAL